MGNSCRRPALMTQPWTLIINSTANVGEEPDHSGLLMRVTSESAGRSSLTESSSIFLRALSSLFSASILIPKASRPVKVTITLPSSTPSSVSRRSDLRSILVVSQSGRGVSIQVPPSLVATNPLTPVSYQGSRPNGKWAVPGSK